MSAGVRIELTTEFRHTAGTNSTEGAWHAGVVLVERVGELEQGCEWISPFGYTSETIALQCLGLDIDSAKPIYPYPHHVEAIKTAAAERLETLGITPKASETEDGPSIAKEPSALTFTADTWDRQRVVYYLFQEIDEGTYLIGAHPSLEGVYADMYDRRMDIGESKLVLGHEVPLDVEAFSRFSAAVERAREREREREQHNEEHERAEYERLRKKFEGGDR